MSSDGLPEYFLKDSNFKKPSGGSGRCSLFRWRYLLSIEAIREKLEFERKCFIYMYTRFALGEFYTLSLLIDLLNEMSIIISKKKSLVPSVGPSLNINVVYLPFILTQ
jgi:hypothetical protein